ncbi:hypothetical protein PV325_006498, partial [Microctonus aethiopoides]
MNNPCCGLGFTAERYTCGVACQTASIRESVIQTSLLTLASEGSVSVPQLDQNAVLWQESVLGSGES